MMMMAVIVFNLLSRLLFLIFFGKFKTFLTIVFFREVPRLQGVDARSNRSIAVKTLLFENL